QATFNLTNIGTTTTAVVPTVSTSTYGTSVTFAATVTNGGSPVTTGTVTFMEGGTTLASNVPVDSNGQANLSINSLSATGHTITPNNNATTPLLTSSGSTSETVPPAPLTITASNASRVYGAADPAFTVNYSGFVLGQDPSVLGGTLSIGATTTPSSNVGT